MKNSLHFLARNFTFLLRLIVPGGWATDCGLRYLNVAAVIHKWCVLKPNPNAIQTKYYKKINRTSSGTSGSSPERCTMTMKAEISTRASLIPILRLGPLLLSDTC